MSKVLITGGTGMLGKLLTKHLLSNGHKVVHFSRKSKPISADGVETFVWNVKAQTADWQALEGTTHLVHLAGANIAAQPWTDAYRTILHDSRVESAKLLIRGLKENNNHQVKGFVSASAIGFYGDAGQQVVTENTPRTSDSFMAKLCEDWENASQEIETMGIRRAIFRIGIVLSDQGGALAKMTPFARLGIGTYFGNGKQIYSWIHEADVARLFVEAIENESFSGVFNAVAPQPEANYEFAKKLNQSLNRPFIPVPAPAFVLKTVMGELSAVVLWGANVSAQKVQQMGFKFRFPDLKSAFADLFQRK